VDYRPLQLAVLGGFYYLDLKTRQGQESTQLLGEMGYYRLLLFARESPQQVENSALSHRPCSTPTTARVGHDQPNVGFSC